jgi:hypothetical protein
MSTRRLTTEEFTAKARARHGNRYDYSETRYTRAIDDVTIICPKHGRFIQRASNHLGGCGCRTCARMSTTKDFIVKAKKVHGGKYDYSQTKYTGAHNRLTIVCPIHGAFQQSATSHLNGNGCRGCAIDESRARPRKTLSREEFISRARKHHGDKYDYSQTRYTRAIDDVIIICPEHGPFTQQASNHGQGAGCPTCAGRLSTGEFIERARRIHGTKYDYTPTRYTRIHDKLTIVCPQHGPFRQTATDHLAGYGCRKCASDRNCPGRC